MKTLLATLLLCLTFTAHAQTWPRNLKTHKVEFTGLLPWPATAKTEAQRKALVKRWYLAKLTDSTPGEVEADAATNMTNGLLTYAGLPRVVTMRAGAGDTRYLLVYALEIVPHSKAASYRIYDFSASSLTTPEPQDGTPLEAHLTTPDKNEQAALESLRKRLVGAVAGWR